MTVEWNILTGMSKQPEDNGQYNSNSYNEQPTTQRWGLYGGYSSSNSRNALVPTQYEQIRNPGLLESANKIIFYKLLTRAKKGELSPIDIKQQKLVDLVNKTFDIAQLEDRAVNPFKINLESAFSSITKKYIEAIPPGVSTPTEIDKEVDKETREMIFRLESGKSDNEYEITEDERKTASEIKDKIGTVPPEELRQIFVEDIYGRANDIVRAQKGNRLAYYQQTLNRNLRKLSHEEPKDWFTVDLLTDILLLTPEERSNMLNIVWTVTPTNIHVRDINRINEDFRRYPISDLARGDEGIIVLPGTVDYVDKVRRVGGPWFQPAINKWASADVGGLVLLRTLQRDEPVAKFVVREPNYTADSLRSVGYVARSVEELHHMMTRSVREPEAAKQFPIRPNKVRELLPDPIVLQMNTLVHPDGTINYGPAIRELEQRKLDLQASLRALALKAAIRLDEEGNPLTEDQRGMQSIENALDRTDDTIKRLQDKN